MKLHMVNGFLGSGKTTAIIAAARHYLREGQQVAVVTNDKGRYQVDQAFFDTTGIPTAQVAGGCFRCSFGEFEERLSMLAQESKPDILFAESVGSCVDLVNTVFPPLRSVPGLTIQAASFSVFTDIRLFRRWINGETLPFNDEIVYTYARQIDETRLLVLNKQDLLGPLQREAVYQSACQRFPDKTILMQDSLAPGGGVEWLRRLESGAADPDMPGFQVDYGQYMAAEKEMAWYDRVLSIQSQQPAGCQQAAAALVGQILQALQIQAIPVAHLKFFISDENSNCKISFTALDLTAGSGDGWRSSLPACENGALKMIINARVETDSQTFSSLVESAVESIRAGGAVQVETRGGSSYQPQVLPAQRESKLVNNSQSWRKSS